MNNKYLVSIIIPAYNEENIIFETITTLQNDRFIKSIKHEIIVIDDGSTDKTAYNAQKTGVTVIKHGKNFGKGEALKTGIHYSSGDVTVFLDADVGDSSTEIIKIIKPVINGDADVSIAKFGKAKRKGGFGVIKFISRYGTRLLTGKSIESVLSGQRALRSDIAKELHIAKGYGAEVGMTIDLLRKGYRIIECEVHMHHNETGRDINGFLHRGRQLMDILRTLIAKLFQK